MRVRSHDACVDIGLAPSAPTNVRTVRARSSKIQNDVIKVHHAGVHIQALVELQALRQKDADTMGSALHNSIKPSLDGIARGIVSNSRGCRRARVIHVVVGDGIPTNDAAMRKMLCAIKQELSLATSVIRYSLIGIICSSHIANLTTHVAIVGDLVARPADNDLLVGNCVRWFKYLRIESAILYQGKHQACRRAERPSIATADCQVDPSLWGTGSTARCMRMF